MQYSPVLLKMWLSPNNPHTHFAVLQCYIIQLLGCFAQSRPGFLARDISTRAGARANPYNGTTSQTEPNSMLAWRHWSNARSDHLSIRRTTITEATQTPQHRRLGVLCSAATSGGHIGTANQEGYVYSGRRLGGKGAQAQNPSATVSKSNTNWITPGHMVSVKVISYFHLGFSEQELPLPRPFPLPVNYRRSRAKGWEAVRV